MANQTTTPTEGLIEIDGAGFYVVPGIGDLDPFLMSVVSDGDRWMFVSSTGALTAGRRDAAGALFPYETDDRLHAAAGVIGPVMRLRVTGEGGPLVWRPFAGRQEAGVHRTIAKSVVGESVLFEERHAGLDLTFRYRWTSTERHGFVRVATIDNERSTGVEIELLDGLVNLLPYGLEPSIYQRFSNLTNAYKRSELIDAPTRLAVFSLESPISDRAEPEEVLRATVAWSTGLPGATVTLDANEVRTFDAGQTSSPTPLVTGRPGAYLLQSKAQLEPGGSARWHIAADVARDQAEVVALRRDLTEHSDLGAELDAAARSSREQLVDVMAPADALQKTGDAVACAHHFANVTYNVMRGGVPLGGYRIDTDDFTAFVAQRNRHVAGRQESWLRTLPDTVDRRELHTWIEDTGDVQLLRLGREYLPFSFSRRHGDPSRPWNQFSIRVRDEAGDPVVYYEGNWRDVFQNWEALCASFPEYLPGVVMVFLNASTVDGFNPYRITSDGIDWEVPDPDDPWSNIGYWGDHQLVYLLRLLAATERHMPGEIGRLLTQRCCTYADVPYRLARYDDLVRDPKSTITFDAEAHARALERAAEVGGDGKLIPGPDGEPHLVTVIEKLLVAALAKISNLVPGGGIWMNTQRPEWNDANNALVGCGLSMVTLYHLRQYMVHLRQLVTESIDREAQISGEVALWLASVTGALRTVSPSVDPSDGDRHRKRVLDGVGRAFSAYRDVVYERRLSPPVAVRRVDILELCDATIAHLDVTIRDARRPDGLFHSYNVVRFAADGESAAVEHLSEMLEGQVAVLGCGVLSSDEQASVVDDLFAGPMYRPDQQTFMLYPVREVPGFLEKNHVPAADIAANPLLRRLLEVEDTTIVRLGVDGVHRFAPDLVHAAALEEALDLLAADDALRKLVEEQRDSVLETYEHVFRHRSFTGRSGSMYAYEGIGSVYWHMVAKLLVVVQEAAVAAASSDEPSAHRLVDAYWRVRAGLGFNKSAADFGAIPTDPYSHTPSHAGAQQPGMTGAVKEEILARSGEVGVRVEHGEIVFDGLLLRSAELLEQPATWTVRTVEGREVVVELGAGSLGFTLCQTPVVVEATFGEPSIEVEFADRPASRHPGARLDRATSAAVFARTGDVTLIRALVRTNLNRGPAAAG